MTAKPDIPASEGPFAVIAHRVRRDGRPYPGGIWLRETATKAAVACETCGPIPVDDDLRGWTSDWLSIAAAARDHARESGHRVAVESWQGSVYGPGEDEERG
jgi:hypothetical protein